MAALYLILWARRTKPSIRSRSATIALQCHNAMIGIYAIWPYFACMALLLAVAATPLLAAADMPPNPRGPRISTLDGLRGFLALAVFFYHGSLYHEYLANGQYLQPPSQFYRLLGPVGVAAFFMITGYLFWSRIVAAGGRQNWSRLYLGRVFRIGPLYLFAIGVMIAIVFVRLGPHLNVSPLAFAKQLVQWFSLGFLTPADFNDYHRTWILLVGVTWTLQFEWYFYLSLPALALAARRERAHLPFVATALIVSLVYAAIFPPDAFPPAAILPALFLIGMTCGSLTRSGLAAKLPDPAASTILAVLVSAVFIGFDSSDTAGAAALLGGAFYLIASGCSFFGLLTSRPARRLGNISYGIYLLQGLVLTIVFSVDRARDIALASPLGFWSMILLCAIALIGVAALAHLGLERTGIELGKRLGGALKSSRDRRDTEWLARARR